MRRRSRGSQPSRTDAYIAEVAPHVAASSGVAEAEATPAPGTMAAYDAGLEDSMPSWEQIVAEHADAVYRLALRLTGNQHDAEDLTQETFLRVFRSLDKYKRGTFRGWVHRVETNLFLDQARRKQTIRFEALPENYDDVPGSEADPLQAFQDANLDPALQKALDELHPDYRVAVVLCDVVGMSYDEISDTLGVKIGTVRSRIHRGRAQLRASLQTANGELRYVG